MPTEPGGSRLVAKLKSENHKVLHRLIVAFAASGSLLLAGCSDATPAADGDIERVTLGDRSFDLELAMAPTSRRDGLGGRETLPENGGMFFVFPDAQLRRFWMFDCVMPIDIAFIDPIGYVTAIHTMPHEELRGEKESLLDYESRLPGYSSAYPAQFAIELAPGSFESLGIAAGDRISIPPERLKTLGKAAEPD